MQIDIVRYNQHHSSYFETWESRNMLASYLSHSKPKYLREKRDDLEEKTLLMMIKVEQIIVGATWLEDITIDNAKLSIYIAEINYRGIGIGTKVIKEMLRIAFHDMKLKEVYLGVRETNTNAIKCYESMGFRIVEVFDKKLFADGSCQKAYRMKLNREEVKHSTQCLDEST